VNGWTALVLAAIILTITAVIVHAAGWLDPRPRHYRGQHRAPQWLDMDRADTTIAADVERGLAAIDAMLEDQSR
jgi:hypothetical protein